MNTYFRFEATLVFAAGLASPSVLAHWQSFPKAAGNSICRCAHLRASHYFSTVLEKVGPECALLLRLRLFDRGPGETTVWDCNQSHSRERH